MFPYLKVVDASGRADSQRMRPWIAAAAVWVGALALAGVGVSLAPTETCDYDNHDAYVVAADRAGAFFAASAVLGSVATLLLLVEVARATGRTRRRVVFALTSLVSLAVVAFAGLAALLNLIAFSCLE
jgi:hypothetical protein